VTTQDPAELVSFVNELADAARGVSTAYFRQSVAVEHKADDSPVTEADRKTESLLRELIEKRFPQHSLLGEEHGRDAKGDEYTWVLDPIDGTKSFISGVPLFGTLIALLHWNEAVLGVVDMPAIAERWVGIRGHRTTFNGVVCETSHCERLGEASLFTTSIDTFEGIDKRRFDALSLAVSFRRFGIDCYAYGLLASGFVDLVVESQLQPYDYLSMVAVIEGAGGKITDWNGKPLGLHSDGRVVAAATPMLHERALELLAD
jgi:histidinol phosphatase-like enzyme (inositol monophosphatase family)